MSNQSLEELIKNVETADSKTKVWLGVKAIAQLQDDKAIPFLIKALSYNNPGAAVAAVDGLINLGDQVVEPLLTNLDYYNYTARAWAIRVFAGIGDPRGLELLLKAASGDFSLSVRRAAATGLGKITWSKLPITEISTAQKQTLETLLLVCEDGEWVVRYSGIVGLQLLGKVLEEKGLVLIKDKLNQLWENDPQLAVKARAKLALDHIAKNEIINLMGR
jgi:phycocyanobilin lyase subunit beta